MIVYIILGIAAVVMAAVGYLLGSKSQTEQIKTLTSERDVQKAYADNYKASLETETERNRQKEAELKESFDRQLADIKEAYDKQLAELKDSHDKQLAQGASGQPAPAHSRADADYVGGNTEAPSRRTWRAKQGTGIEDN